MKYLLLTILFLLLSLSVSSQSYIFESYSRSESIKKIKKDTIISNKQRTLTIRTEWSDWKTDSRKIILDLDKKQISIESEYNPMMPTHDVYNIIVRDSEINDVRIIAMLTEKDGKKYYIRFIKQEGFSYYIYIDDKDKSIAYMAIMIKNP